VNDIAWLLVWDDVAELTKKLEQCAKLRKRWAENNAVKFELAKTEVILFSKKKRRHWNGRLKGGIQVEVIKSALLER
jgi:phosphoribosyl-AMP cyclohydrolase